MGEGIERDIKKTVFVIVTSSVKSDGLQNVKSKALVIEV